MFIIIFNTVDMGATDQKACCCSHEWWAYNNSIAMTKTKDVA